jgi:hypothetical protein
MVDPSTCPACGRDLVGRHNFCPFCGHDLREWAKPATLLRETARGQIPPTSQTDEPAPAAASSALPLRSPASAGRRERLRLFDRRVLFGIIGLLELPIIALLVFLLVRPPLLQPPPTLICDDLNSAEFATARFQTGLGGELNEDTIFTASSTYVIQDVLVVPSSRRLLIESGAILEFEAEAGIDVHGALYACGSERAPITFTSPDGRAGSWRGLRFENADESSTLRHTLIQFAGDRAVELLSSGPMFYDVKITNSSAFPISSNGHLLPGTMVDVALEGNPFVGIEMQGGALPDVQNIRWPNHSLIYVVSGPVEIGANTALTIDPQTVIKFWQPPRGNSPGLQIRGLVKAEDVRFTSVYDSRDEAGGPTHLEARDPAPGDWAGLSFIESSNHSFLRRVLVQYAGRDRGAVYFQASSPELSDVTIADSAWYPLSADADSSPLLEGVTLRANEPGDALEIRGGSTITGRQQRSWGILGQGAPIVRVIRGEIRIGPEATLSIEPGVVVKFEPRSRLVVQGTLQAMGGGADEHIVFTSLRDGDHGGQTDRNRGPQDERQWDGIIFDKSDDNSILENVLIRYGSIGLNDAAPRLANIYIRDSSAPAIVVTANSAPTLRDNRFENNDINGIAVQGGELTTDQIWTSTGVLDGPLVRVISGRVTVNPGSTLQLEPGTIVKADEGARLLVRGDLRVRGQETQPVIFTSLHDDEAGGDTNSRLRAPAAGDWVGIEASEGAVLDFSYAEIRYAQTGLILHGDRGPAIVGWLRVHYGERALHCSESPSIPAGFLARENQTNDQRCPTD